MPWGAIPWPDDLYLKDGHVAVTSLPFESAALGELVEGALETVDGAGVRPTIVVAFDGELDRESLPGSPMASVAPESSVFLIDADASSPDAFERLPLDVELSRDRRSIRARVAYERALVPGRRYAAVVTDGVRSRTARRRVGGSLRLERILDAEVPLSDARERLARAQYSPILPALERRGIAPSRVVALSSFRVQSAGEDLDEARASLSDRDAAEEPRFQPLIEGATALEKALGKPRPDRTGAVLGRGVDHDHIAALAHLTIRAPVFANVAPGGRNAFERDEDGVLIRRGKHEVPCTLVVPRSVGSSALSVILYQHGLFAERSDALPVANALAANGSAVLTCDAPLHGSRLPDSDTGNRFTVALEPDGFGDVNDDILGREPDTGDLPPGHPFYYRDAIQQAVVDWMAIVATLRSGAWDDALGDALEVEGLAVARDSIGFVGTDVGAEIGVALAAREPVIGAVVLAFTGGRSIDDWNEGPDYAPLREAYAELLDSDDAQGFEPRFRVDASMLRILLDPATSLAHAQRLRASGTNVLSYVAANDELVPLASSEALAFGLGEDLVDAEPVYELDLRRNAAQGGNAANFALPRGHVTRISQALTRATRTTLFSDRGALRYEHPLDLPPVALDKTRMLDNPTEAVLRQVVFFFESYRACLATRVDPLVPCAATVATLQTAR